MVTPLLALDAVHEVYGPVHAVIDVSLAVGQGEIVAPLGPTGAGRTTLIREIVGLTRPDRGSVAYHVGGPTRPTLPPALVGYRPGAFAAVGMLVYGEEPALRATWRWVREA